MLMLNSDKQGVVEIQTFSKADIFFLDIFTRQYYEDIIDAIFRFINIQCRLNSL